MWDDREVPELEGLLSDYRIWLGMMLAFSAVSRSHNVSATPGMWNLHGRALGRRCNFADRGISVENSARMF